MPVIGLPATAGREELQDDVLQSRSDLWRNRITKQPWSYLNSGNYRWNAGMFIWSFVTVTARIGEASTGDGRRPARRWFKVANQPAKLKKVLAKEYPEYEEDFDRLCDCLEARPECGEWPTEHLNGTTWVHGQRWAAREARCGREQRGGQNSSMWMRRGISFMMRERRTGRRLRVVGLRVCDHVQTDDATIGCPQKARRRRSRKW